MKEFIKKITVRFIAVAIGISIGIGFIEIQKKAFFHPSNDEAAYNELRENENYSEISIDVGGKKLSGWMNIKTIEKESPLLILFLGNSQNSSNFCKYFEKGFEYFANYNTLIVDYPGYGYSEGNLDENEIFNNALKIYDYATDLEIVDSNNIVIMGYSIGTGVATYLSSKRDVNGLILVAPYDNALSLYNDNLNIFYGFLEEIRRYKFESDVYAKDVKTDPLIICSKKDEVIKYEHSLRLSENFSRINKMVILENIGHSYFFSDYTVLSEIKQYLEER